MKKIMIFAAATLLMSSCGLYNKYERPDVNTEGLIRDAANDYDTLAVQDTASFGNLPWRQVFTDPQLQAYIEQGLQKNANLQNAALTVEMYETMLKAAKLAFLPAVQFGSNTGMGSISTLYTDPSVTTKSYTLPVTASWQYPFAETFHADEAVRLQGLSDGSPRSGYQWHCQLLLHTFDAGQTGGDC